MRSAPGFPGRHPAARTRQASRRGGPQRHRLQDRRARLHRGAAAPGRDVGEPVRRARSTSLRAACGHGRSSRSRSSSAGFVSASVTATETWLSGRICVPFATCARRIVAGCWVIRWAICTSRIVPRRRRAGGFSRTYRGPTENRPAGSPQPPARIPWSEDVAGRLPHVLLCAPAIAGKSPAAARSRRGDSNSGPPAYKAGALTS
jgi:hypothetical protein